MHRVHTSPLGRALLASLIMLPGLAKVAATVTAFPRIGGSPGKLDGGTVDPTMAKGESVRFRICEVWDYPLEVLQFFSGLPVHFCGLPDLPVYSAVPILTP